MTNETRQTIAAIVHHKPGNGWAVRVYEGRESELYDLIREYKRDAQRAGVTCDIDAAERYLDRMIAAI